MAFGLLQSILNDITGHKAAPVKAPQKPSDIPSLAQFTQAMINTKPQDIPQDNLDGTYTNLRPGGAVVAPAPWHPPLQVGVEDHSGMPYYTPLSKSAGEYTDDSYYRLPINPNVVPKPMQLLKPMLQGVPR